MTNPIFLCASSRHLRHKLLRRKVTALPQSAKYRAAICRTKEPAAFRRLKIWAFHPFSRKFLVLDCRVQACLSCCVKPYPEVEPNGKDKREKETKQGNGRPTNCHGQLLIMYLETDCTSISIDKWNELMKGARKASYPRLVGRIKKEMPELYSALTLNFYNPWCDQCKQTRTHFILVHSAIEYFIKK